VIFFVPLHASTHASKQLVHTGKLVRSKKSYICPCIICFKLEFKTKCKSSGKHIFRNKAQVVRVISELTVGSGIKYLKDTRSQQRSVYTVDD
jgi:hypothetical protein